MSDIQEEQKRLYKRAEENDIKLLKEEINRLNNIIDELKKYLIEMSDKSWDDNGAYDDVLDKLNELKEK